MKTRLIKILTAGILGTVAISTALAQTSSTTTTTTTADGRVIAEKTTTTTTEPLTGAGTVTTYTPGSDYITFRGAESSAPARYYYTKKTVLVDPEGRTVEWSALRPDMPVQYTYVRDGDRMVVTKVTLQKPLTYYEKRETTTTTVTRP